MEKSKVYFTDMRCGTNTNQLQKLQRLIKTAGIGDIDLDGKFTAIKIHFGEPEICPSCARISRKRSRMLLRSSAASRS